MTKLARGFVAAAYTDGSPWNREPAGESVAHRQLTNEQLTQLIKSYRVTEPASRPVSYATAAVQLSDRDALFPTNTAPPLPLRKFFLHVAAEDLWPRISSAHYQSI